MKGWLWAVMGRTQDGVGVGDGITVTHFFLRAPMTKKPETHKKCNFSLTFDGCKDAELMVVGISNELMQWKDVSQNETWRPGHSRRQGGIKNRSREHNESGVTDCATIIPSLR